jgi:hypothetical protein
MATLFADLADLHTNAVLSGQVLLLLAARGSLPMHPAMIFGGTTNGAGSNTLNFPQVGLMGYDLLDDVADGAQAVPIAITDAVSSLTPARKVKAYEPSDLARWTDATGTINAAAFAQDAVATFQATQLALLSALGPAFTATSGPGTGSDLTGADHLGARIALEMANVPGPYLAVYHSRQIGDLALDAEGAAAGAFQWSEDAQRVMQDGFAGRFLGVDIYRANHVPATSGDADRAGSMFGRGAVVWGALSVSPEGDEQVALGPYILFERARQGLAGVTAYIQSAYLDFQLAIDEAGTEVLSDY